MPSFFRKHSIAVFALAMLAGGTCRAGLFSEVVDMAESMSDWASALRDCGLHCEGGPAEASFSALIRGRAAQDALVSRLSAEFPEFSGVLKTSLSAPSRLISGYLLVRSIKDNAREMSWVLDQLKNSKTIAKLADCREWLMHRLGMALISDPSVEFRFVQFYVIAQRLDDGSGKYLNYAKKLMAFRLALGDGRSKVIEAFLILGDEDALRRRFDNLERLASFADEPDKVDFAWRGLGGIVANFQILWEAEGLRLVPGSVNEMISLSSAAREIAPAIFKKWIGWTVKELDEGVVEPDQAWQLITDRWAALRVFSGREVNRVPLFQLVGRIIRANPDIGNLGDFHRLMAIDPSFSNYMREHYMLR